MALKQQLRKHHRSRKCRGYDHDGGQEVDQRRVHFAPSESLCSHHASSWQTLTLEMISNGWFRDDDFAAFRQDSRISCAEAQEKQMDKLFLNQHTYGATQPKNQQALTKWCRVKDTRRGLERFVSQEYFILRNQAKEKYIQSVLYTQENLDLEGDVDYEHRASAMARAAKNISRPAKTFAYMLGKADQEAVNQNLGVSKRKAFVSGHAATHSFHSDTLLSGNTKPALRRTESTEVSRHVLRNDSGDSVNLFRQKMERLQGSQTTIISREKEFSSEESLSSSTSSRSFLEEGDDSICSQISDVVLQVTTKEEESRSAAPSPVLICA